MRTVALRLRQILSIATIAALAAGCACGDDDDDDHAGPDASADDGGGPDPDGAARDGGDGDRDADIPACADPDPEHVLAVAGFGGLGTHGVYLLVTGTVPDAIDGSPVAAVEVGGSARGVRWDPERAIFTYLLARPDGDQIDLEIVARAASGATATTGYGATLEPLGDSGSRDLDPEDHTVGTWMFTWFTGDPGWACGSPWRPLAGFESWDGSVGWARRQLLDQMDARIDLVGLQLDTIVSAGPRGVRFDNAMRALDAARELFDEGFAPPRLLPLVDTAILADFYLQDTGQTLDLGTSEGRDLLYDFFAVPWRELQARLGPHARFAGARVDGLPMVAMWHSVTIDGEDDAVLRSLKERFAAELGAEPYLVAHPNDWRLYDEIDEVTLMFGPPEHFWADGRDTTGRVTINVEAGFWNPISNDFYLPREAGVHFDDAWVEALLRRDDARHLWIDSWNETGEGSGIFEAEPVDYAADDGGPCGDFVHRHADSWGPSARHYIDVVRDNAIAWTAAPSWDAELVTHDLPATLRPGERRWASVVLRNTGGASWPGQGGPRLVARGADEFGAGTSHPLPDPSLAGLPGGIPRGAPAVFPVLLTGPCEGDQHTLRLGLIDPDGDPFGPDVEVQVSY